MSRKYAIYKYYSGGETYVKKLNQFDVIIPDRISENIVLKVLSTFSNKSSNFSQIVGSVGEYGLPGSWRFIDGDIEVITSAGIFNCDSQDLKSLQDIDRYKVVVSSISCEHAGESDKNGMYKVLTIIRIARKNQVFAGDYIKVAAFDKIEYANNCVKYLKTKLVRLLLNIRKVGIHITRDSYKFVPLQDFSVTSDIDWSLTVQEIDKQLYKKYNLTQEEIDYIERTIKPME